MTTVKEIEDNIQRLEERRLKGVSGKTLGEPEKPIFICDVCPVCVEKTISQRQDYVEAFYCKQCGKSLYWEDNLGPNGCMALLPKERSDVVLPYWHIDEDQK